MTIKATLQKSFVYNTFYFLVKNGSGPIDIATLLSFDAVSVEKEIEHGIASK